MIPFDSRESASVEGLDGLSRFLLEAISILDDYGARTVSPRLVGFVTFLALGAIKLIAGKKYGVDWYSLIHSLVSGPLALVCVYLDEFAVLTITGSSSFTCGPPLTSLHRILPAITMGYSVFDITDSLSMGPAFLAHGVATFSVMVFFAEIDAPHLVVGMLIMEVSTIFLNFVKAEFLSDLGSLMNQLAFAVTFFLFRVVLSPYLWQKEVIAMYNGLHSDSDFPNCFHAAVFPLTVVLGVFFHTLNLYWFYKIVRKARRKLSGTERIKQSNDLDEKSEQSKPKEE